MDRLVESGQIAMRFMDNSGTVATTYPANPNGSPDGITGVSSDDGDADDASPGAFTARCKTPGTG